MPRSNRENLIRNAAQAALHMQTAQRELAELWAIVKEDPLKRGYDEPLSAMMVTLESTLETLGAYSTMMWELSLEDLENRR